MATVRIGEKDLEIKPATLGFLKYKLIPARAKLAAAQDEAAMVDAAAGLLLAYLEDNPGIDLEWLLANVPADPGDVLRACAAAAGQKVGVSAGEAKSQ